MTAPSVIVAGTGTVGRDLGRYLLDKGCTVTWLSRDGVRLARLQAGTEALGIGRASFRRLDQADLPAVDLAIECVEEDLGAKRAVVGRLARAAGPGTVVASASSALLPTEIHPACIGLRPLVPLTMTGMAELIAPTALSASAARLRSLLGRIGLRVIDQNERTAFAATRLLLPVQALAVELLKRGWPAAEVDAWSSGPFFPRGILGFMDAVGLDTIRSAVAAYRRRMPPAEAAAYGPLEEGLTVMLAAGKRGNRNADGFMRGGPTPWPAVSPDTPLPEGVGDLFTDLLLASCARFLDRDQISSADLTALFTEVYGAADSPVSLLERDQPAASGGRRPEVLARLGLTGWEPASTLARSIGED